MIGNQVCMWVTDKNNLSEQFDRSPQNLCQKWSFSIWCHFFFVFLFDEWYLHLNSISHSLLCFYKKISNMKQGLCFKRLQSMLQTKKSLQKRDQGKNCKCVCENEVDLHFSDYKKKKKKKSLNKVSSILKTLYW